MDDGFAGLMMGLVMLMLLVSSVTLLGLVVWLIFSMSWTFIFAVAPVLVLVGCTGLGTGMMLGEWKESR